MNEIQLGIKAKDVITGFEGIVVAKAQHLTGCDQVCLLPNTLDKDGKRRDAEWFDSSRIEVLDAKPLQLPGKETIKQHPGADERLPRVR